MGKYSKFWAVLLGSFIVVASLWALKNDMEAIPPSFGPGHQQAYDGLYEQAPNDVDLPPPSKAAYGDVTTSESDPFPLFEYNELSPRAGFSGPTNDSLETWARRLGAGWYLDWRVQPRYPTQKPEHWQMVRLSQGDIYPDKEAIAWVASHYPGNVWIIGNEPDNIWQDNLYPEEYAQVYHDLYYLIKEADPKAQVAVAGVTQGTALRLAYLDRVLTTYQESYHEPMPVDWWTVHGYVLREERGGWGAEIPTGFPAINSGDLYEIPDTGSVEDFEILIIKFRTWMADNGFQDTPLALTEFGILFSEDYGYTPEVVAEYLAQTFTWLDQAKDLLIGYPQDEYRLVQRWAWFSLFDKLYYASNLANYEADAVTDIGWEFRKFVEEQRP